MTALDLPAAALRGIASVTWPDGPAGIGKPMVGLALSLREQVAEAAAREVMAEVTKVLVDGWSPKHLTDAPHVVMGYQNALRDIATALGVDLDAALAKEEL